MFIEHPDAGQKSAIIYTLLNCCRIHSVDPQANFMDVLEKLIPYDHRPPDELIEALLPENWIQANPDKVFKEQREFNSPIPQRLGGHFPDEYKQPTGSPSEFLQVLGHPLKFEFLSLSFEGPDAQLCKKNPGWILGESGSVFRYHPRLTQQKACQCISFLIHPSPTST